WVEVRPTASGVRWWPSDQPRQPACSVYWPKVQEHGCANGQVESGSGADVPAAGIREGGSTHPIKPRRLLMRTPRSHTALENPPSQSTLEDRSRFVRGRLVGAAAIAFAGSGGVENAVLAGTGAPAFGDPIEEVLAYYAANRVSVAIASSSIALSLPLLLVFVTGLPGLVGRAGAGHLPAGRRPADRPRAPRRRARRADARVRARLAGSRGGVRAGAADARHHLHRRGPRHARER